MSYHWISNKRRGLPLDGQHIHAIDCPCTDCTLDRRRGLRVDLAVIAFGMAAAIAAVAVLWLAGIR